MSINDREGFPAGTPVRTSTGVKLIENITEGETIIGFNKAGALEFGSVYSLKKYKATPGIHNVYYIEDATGQLFPYGVATGHGIFVEGFVNFFKKAEDLLVGDTLVKIDLSTTTITNITVDNNFSDYIYSFGVYPLNTFLVGGLDTAIRVHNGGKSGGGNTAVEAQNTLQSNSIAKILEVISYGEILGVVGGAVGVLLNNTQLLNPDGSPNFEGAYFNQRVGLPSQTHIPGFNEVTSEVPLPGTVITNSGVTVQLPNKNIDAAVVTISFPEGLWKYNLENGSQNGFSVRFYIYIKNRLSNTWILVIDQIISDKTTSAWEIAYRVKAPINATNWDIRVVRVSPEDQVSSEKSVIKLIRITEIVEETRTYNNIAYAGTILKASTIGNQIPTRTFDVMGIVCKVPNNYNTITRNYGTSYWNGGFIRAWTNNPAWVLYDIITNPDYGLNTFLNQPIEVDIWSFYEASLYNDSATWDGTKYTYNYLPDGQGGIEVRYTFNGVISSQLDAWQVIQAIASNMRAIVIMKGTQVSILQDRPRASRRIINNSNVIDGLFIYSGSDVTDRATIVHCTFNDKTERYLPVTVSEEDTSAIQKYGYIVKNIVAYGCTSEGQARRQAKAELYAETHVTDLVSFSLALNIVDLQIGDVVSIMDNEYISDKNIYLTGRVNKVTGAVVEFDSEVSFQNGVTYNIGIMNPARNDILESTYTATGPASTITTDTAFPAGDYATNEFFCYSQGTFEPRDFQIMSINETAKGKYAISAVYYDKNKFDAVEQNIVVAPIKHTVGVSVYLPPVTNISFSEVFMNTGSVIENHIQVTWEWNEDNELTDTVTYSVRWRRDSGNYTKVDNIPTKSFSIPSIAPGFYEVLIEAVNSLGKKSVPLYSSYNYRTQSGLSTLEPPENFYVVGTTQDLFTGKHVPLQWTFPTANENKTDTLLDYVLEIWSIDNLTLLNTYIIPPDAARNGSFTYTFEFNINDYGSPNREVHTKLYSRDVIGDLSEPLYKVFTNPVPEQANYTLLSGFGNVYINITPVDDLDVAGYVVYRGESPGVDPATASLVYTGPDNYIALESTPDVTFYYKVAAFDTFGKAGLNYSSEQTSKSISGRAPVWIFDGLFFTANDPNTNDASWTSGSASKDGDTPRSISPGTATWTTGTLYIYYDGAATTLSTTTDLAVAVTGAQILASYHGGTDLVTGNGSAYIDGGLILANTVGANQLVVDSAIITSNLQVAGAVIKETHIDVAQINEAHLKNAIIKTAHIKDANITNAKLATASVSKLKVQTAAIDTLQVAGNAITVPTSIYSAGAIAFSTTPTLAIQLYVPPEAIGYKAVVTFSFDKQTQISSDLTEHLRNVLASFYVNGSLAYSQWHVGTLITKQLSFTVAANTGITYQLYLHQNPALVSGGVGAHSGRSISSFAAKR